MTRSRRSTSAAGALRRTELVRNVLRRADTRDGGIFTFDEVSAWEPGDLKWLLARSILRQGPRAPMIWLPECDSAEAVEPAWFTDAKTSQTVGLVGCEVCGTTHRVDPRRMATWEFCLAGLAAAVAPVTGAEGGIETLVPDRAVRLGTLMHERRGYELLLLRGLGWRDHLIGQSSRLGESRAAMVLSLSEIPPMAIWPTGWHQVLSLPEHLSVSGASLILPIRFAPALPAGPGPVSELALSEQERDVLDALADSGEPLLNVELQARAGYGKHTIALIVRRLLELRLIVRAGGAARKGVVLSPSGRRAIAAGGTRGGPASRK